jgi:AcrR family transcriptional regulator
MARPNNPQARQALIDAAVELFVEKGLAKSRVEDITRRCGLSKGAFYLHFSSKEALFGEQVDALMREMNDLYRRRQAPYRALFQAAGQNNTAARSEAHALSQSLMAHDKKFDLETLEALWRRRAVVDVLFHGSRGTPFDSVVWQFIDAESRRVQRELKRMRQLGLCRDDLPDEIVAAQAIGGWVMLSRSMARLKRKPDLGRWVESSSSMLYQGISTSPQVRAYRQKSLP